MKEKITYYDIITNGYFVNENGVYSCLSHKMLKLRKDKNGYLKVNLIINKKHYTFYIQQLIALLTISKYEYIGQYSLTFLDGNKENFNRNNIAIKFNY